MSDSNYNHSNRKPVVENVQSPLTLKTHSTAVSYLTAGESAILVTDTSAPRTITIATADLVDGRQIEVTDASGLASVNNITVQGQAGELINGQATLVIESDYGCTTLVCSGGAWYTAGGGGAPVPVQKDGVEVLASPKALNFKNAIVEDSAGVADIDFPNAALGGYTERLIDSPNDVSETSSSYVDISGLSNQTFVTPVSGVHVISLEWVGWAEFSWARAQIQLLIDDSVAVELPITELSDGVTLPISQAVVATLASGSHTIRPQWKRTHGTGSLRTNGAIYSWRMLIQAQGTGINGLEVVESVLASPFTVVADYNGAVPGGGMAQVDSVECVVSTLEGERVQVIWNGDFSNALTEHVMGYQVDGGAAVACHYSVPITVGTYLPGNWSVFTAPLSAGQHTIKLMAARTPSVPYDISAQSYLEPGTFQVARFKSDGIGAGSVTATDTLVGDTTITTRHPTLMDTGLEVLVNTVTNETVLLNFSGYAAAASGLSSGIFLYYQVDGDPEVLLTVDSTEQIPTTEKNISASASVLIPAAGAHTIRLRAGTSLVDWAIHAEAARLSVTQYRGGQIPFKNDGALVENTPVDVDFGPEFELTSTAKSVSVRTAPGFMRVVQPSEGGAGIQAAILAADAAGGGIVQLMEGTYAIAAVITGAGLNNVTLRGIGRGTVLDIGDLSGYPAIWLRGNTTLTAAVLTGPLAKGDASVFLDTPSLYTDILEGDRLWIRGADPDSEFDGFAAVAAADALPTGEVPLLSLVPRAITSPTVSVFRNGNGLRVQDLRFVSAVGTHSDAINLSHTGGAVVEGVVFDRLASTNSGCYIVDGFDGRVSHCEFLGLTSRSVSLSGVYRATIDHNTVDNGGTYGIAVYGDAVETEIADNKISASGPCVLLNDTYRHIRIANNVLQNGQYGVDAGGSGLEVSAIGNTFQSCEIGFSNGSYQSGKRHVVSGNTFTDCTYPFNTLNGFHCVISDNLFENLRAGGNAIMVQQGVAPAGYHTITGNVIRECPGVGIYVEDNAHTVVSNNVITGAGLIGISLYGTGVGIGSSVGHAVVGNVVESSGIAIDANNEVSDSLVANNNCRGGTISEGLGANVFVNNLV